MADVALGELVTFSNGRSRPAAGTRYRTFGANGVIGTSGGFNAGPGSTIVGRVGSFCGTVHYSPDPCWATDNAIIATAKDGVNARYVHYLLKRLGLNRYRIGSGQPLLTHAILSGLTAPRLSRAEQDAAASVLGALDDKIEVNGRIAACGDALVRARYDESASTAASVMPIGELGDLVRRNVPPQRIGRDENYIALEHMPKRHMWLSTWTDGSGATSAKRRFAAGDVLFGKLRPAFHKVGLAFVDGVASTDILVVRPRDAARRGGSSPPWRATTWWRTPAPSATARGCRAPGGRTSPPSRSPGPATPPSARSAVSPPRWRAGWRPPRRRARPSPSSATPSCRN